MIRSAVLLLVMLLGVLVASGGSGIYDGAAIMAACVAGFGLLVMVFTGLMREN